MSNEIFHRLDALGHGILAGRAYPKGGDEANPLVRLVHRAAADWIELDRSAGAAAATLAPEGRRDALAGHHLKALAATRKAQAALDAEAARLAADVRAFEQPAPADPAQTIIDGELRAYFRRAEPAERDALEVSMANGNDAALLAAMARFPASAVDANRARDMYRAHQRAAHPETVAALDARDELVGWSRSWMAQLAQVSDSAVRNGVTEPSALVVT